MPAVIESNVESLVRSVTVLAVLALAYVAVARGMRRILGRLSRGGRESATRGATLWGMLRRLVIFVFLVTGALTVAGIWNVSIAPLLAVGSAVGVAVGLGAQGLVRDVIAGFFILAEDQFRIGDVVELAGVAGAVEAIRPRVTVLRDLDGNVHYIPHGQITVATNLTSQFAQVVVDVAVGYRVDLDGALAILTDELGLFATDPAWSGIVIEDPEVLGVEQLATSGVILRAVLKVAAPERWRVKRELLRRLKNRLDAEGIEIPYPVFTIYRGGTA